MMYDFEKIQALTDRFIGLGIEQSLDWLKYNYYALVHHSTCIEGATLTLIETELLLDQDITSKAKPLTDHLMVSDHYKALKYVLEAAGKGEPVSLEFLRHISHLTMKNTGSSYNTIGGCFDASLGQLRLLNNYAGQTRFPDFKKVPEMLERFCREVNDGLAGAKTSEEFYNLSFDAHFNLVSIHPFADGNGRVSRLVMNYIQMRGKLPLTIVHKEDKADYYKALVDTRNAEDIGIFRDFMYGQHQKFLEREISKVEVAEEKSEQFLKDKKKGRGISFIF